MTINSFEKDGGNETGSLAAAVVADRDDQADDGSAFESCVSSAEHHDPQDREAQTKRLLKNDNGEGFDNNQSQGVGDEEEQEYEAAVEIPQSTHSLLFTEAVHSMPFVFGLGIAGMSCGCLILALVNNLKYGSVPASINPSVIVAQYLSILIALLMEEEIPTGLYLLRRISQQQFKSEFPELEYSRFVASSTLRITMGYLFLVNVMIILAQADGVVEIFYDVLALQFIQQLDDIAFALSRMDVLGMRMCRATTTRYFHVDFKRDQSSMRKRRIQMFLKGVYFVNLLAFLTAMIWITMRQMSGYYQCESITVTFPDRVWSEAIVQWPEDSFRYQWRPIEEKILIYSSFSGVYVKHQTRTHEGRPIYVEQKKTDRTPFDMDAPFNSLSNYDADPVVPAEIKYCGGYWVFTHEYIRKSREERNTENSNCHWLLRSEKTAGFDFLETNGGAWSLWTGVISETTVSSKCNECSDDTDCNLNGECNTANGVCNCYEDDGVEYLGAHCEVKVKDECRTIIGEGDNEKWSLDEALFPGHNGEIFQTYSRPVYTYVSGLPENSQPSENDNLALVYSGGRWFSVVMSGSRLDQGLEWQTSNYHAFWSGSYSPETTKFLSNPTTNDSPVGVDFFRVGEQGNQFGPYGVLYPMQNQTGRGVYRCEGDSPCSFCPTGVSHVTYNPDQCRLVKHLERICCQNEKTQDSLFSVDAALEASDNGSSVGHCSFCSEMAVAKDLVIPKGGGATCEEVFAYAKTLDGNSDSCREIQLAEMACCLP